MLLPCLLIQHNKDGSGVLRCITIVFIAILTQITYIKQTKFAQLKKTSLAQLKKTSLGRGQNQVSNKTSNKSSTLPSGSRLATINKLSNDSFRQSINKGWLQY